jgi:hypothetical protein
LKKFDKWGDRWAEWEAVEDRLKGWERMEKRADHRIVRMAQSRQKVDFIDL